VCLFRHAILNKPARIVTTAFTRIEHHFIALESATILFIKVKKVSFVNSDNFDIKAQVLAECAACDY
jgi:hypothetical protein